MLARSQRKPIFTIKVYWRMILQCNESWTPYIHGRLPRMMFDETILFHCNRSWKYIVIRQVKSSEIPVFLYLVIGPNYKTMNCVVCLGDCLIFAKYLIFKPHIEGWQAKVHNSTFCGKWVFDIKICWILRSFLLAKVHIMSYALLCVPNKLLHHDSPNS